MTPLQNCKHKALVLIQYSDRTEAEIKARLNNEAYEEDVIQSTISFLKQHGYINDIRYSESFIRRMGRNKSRLQIKINLLNKGVSTEDIDTAFEGTDKEQEFLGSDLEEEAIYKAIFKSIRRKAELTKEDKRKLFASLYRKGFPVEKIKKVWNEILHDAEDCIETLSS